MTDATPAPMLHPKHHARNFPDKPAIVMAGSGRSLSYRELDQRSNQIAHYFRGLGLQPRDHIAIYMENNLDFMQIVWAAQRSGLIFTAISTQLKTQEVHYIVCNCDARLVVTSAAFAGMTDAVRALGTPQVEWYCTVDATQPGYESLEAATAHLPTTPIADEEGGFQMLYSSGTTGQPKGVLPDRPRGIPIDQPSKNFQGMGRFFGFGSDTVYLSTAPLYHAAPLGHCLITMHFGGTAVIMEKFDAAQALALIERHRVTHIQMVPIMFVRLLGLPEAERQRHDVSSLRSVFHSAAPCPVPIKRQMIDWWGPVILEYYASSEGAGFTALNAREWLQHPGSVGRPFNCEIHIVREDGTAALPGEAGVVYFSGSQTFSYYKEPEKTQGSFNAAGWSTVGDIGYLDAEGYLYLTDRQSFMIISGGVNIYPQEIENLLLTHPKVADVAVFGVPNDEFGEEVKAVVQPKVWHDAGTALANELMAWCREQFAAYKAPRSIDFESQLPRHENGKLYKRLLADKYRQAHEARRRESAS